jgi:hypothetical protein
VRGRWAQRNADSNKDGGSGSPISASRSNSIAEAPVEVNKLDLGKTSPPMPTTTAGALRPFALGLRRPSNTNIGAASSSSSSSVSGSSASSTPVSPPVGAALASWGAGIGSFISTRLAKQPSVQGLAKEKEGGDSVSGRGSVGGEVEGKDETRVRGMEEGGRVSEPVSQPVTPQAVRTPKVNVTSPGGTTPVAGKFEETPPSTASTMGKTRVASAGTNGTGGRVRAAVLERERAQGEWSPKDVTSGVHLLLRDDGDKAYGQKILMSSPPRRAKSNTPKEVGEDPYPQRKDVDVHFRDPFAAPPSKGGEELHREVDHLHHGSQDESHRVSTDSSAYSISIKSLDEEDAYAGMAM